MCQCLWKGQADPDLGACTYTGRVRARPLAVTPHPPWPLHQSPTPHGCRRAGGAVLCEKPPGSRRVATAVPCGSRQPCMPSGPCPAEVVRNVNELIATGQYGRLFAVVHFASHQWKVTPEDLILINNELDIACGERIRLEKVRLGFLLCPGTRHQRCDPWVVPMEVCSGWRESKTWGQRGSGEGAGGAGVGRAGRCPPGRLTREPCSSPGTPAVSADGLLSRWHVPQTCPPAGVAEAQVRLWGFQAPYLWGNAAFWLECGSAGRLPWG